MEKVRIEIVGPESGCAPMPAFEEKAFNESRILHEERYKGADLYFTPEQKTGTCDWIAQEAEKPSLEFFAEVLRAFKACGAPIGTRINILFRGRSNPRGTVKKFTRTVQ